MSFVIVPDFSLLSAVRHEKASHSGAEEARTAFNIAHEICTKCDGQPKIILAEQIINELKFTDEQKIALDPFCHFDKTTVGVAGYYPKNCVVETANSWLTKKVIVLTDGSIKLTFPKNDNLVVVSPKEFATYYKKAEELNQRFKEFNLTQILLFFFFGIKPNIKK